MSTNSNNQHAFGQFRLLLFLAALPFVAWGCSGIDPARIAPKAPAQPVSKIGTSIKVMDVTGGQKSTFGGAEMINNEQFKKALILALDRSGLFNSVSPDSGDVDLYATIRSEGQKTSRGLQYTATMVVTYKFVEPATSNVIWTASYDSEFSSTAFSGATRTLEAREGSARENLASLIQGIRQQWPKKQAARR
jgi:hypothetical protein